MIMDEDVKKKITGLIDKAIGEIKIAGVKGDQLFAFLRSVTENYRFKRKQHGEAAIQEGLDDLVKSIEAHLVIESEKEEEGVLKHEIKEIVLIYLILHSIHLFERRDLLDLKKMVKEFEEHFPHVDKETAKEFKDSMHAIIKEWEDELEAERKMINAVWAEAKGDKGWALSMFKKLHSEGLLSRLKERSLFKDTLHEAKAVENQIEKLGSVKNRDELKALLGKVEKEEKEMTFDFEKLWQFVEMSWETVNSKLDKLVEIIHAAVFAHELPELDEKDTLEVKGLIINKLDEKMMAALRREIKQLEAIDTDVKSEVD
jgi:hypothetical protein